MLELLKEPIILFAIAAIVIFRSFYKGYTGETIENKPKEKPFQIRGKREIPPKYLIEDGKSCPKCGLEPKKLQWTYYSSPKWAWENLCGEKGFISSCPNCKIEVEVAEIARS